MATKTLATELKETILPEIGKELDIKNVMALPKIAKVKVAVGVGKFARKGGSSNAMDEAILKEVAEHLAIITGQQPRTHDSRQSISNFKLREGMPIGLSVTLRGERAIDFLSRLVNVALPRVRDFQGLKTKFDGNGNYSFGLRDYSVFPEIEPDTVDRIHGLQVTVETTTNDDETARLLLKKIGFPFKK